MNITIGITTPEQARITQAVLEAIGTECTCIQMGESALDALRLGDIQALAGDLAMLSAEPVEGVAITAVSARENPADCLLIRPEAYVATEIFKLKKNAALGCFSVIQQAQFQENRADVNIQLLLPGVAEALEQLKQGRLDALLLSEAAANAFPLDGFGKIALNPLEFVPAPAQGVVTWQCLSADIPTRQLFQRIHHSEVSACTNVERKVLRLLGVEYSGHLGVYCTRDENGFYHAVAAALIQGELRTARMSSSTNFGLAENLVRQLNA